MKGLNYALTLSLFTIFYNLVEGSVCTYFGSSDETLALLGFGVDSFVEVLSGIGIAHMILRMRRHSIDSHDRFEITALKITGWAFYLLVAGLIFGAVLSIVQQAQPERTLVGIVISIISILTMYVLYYQKIKVGTTLNSEPIISDAKCTKTCFYLSFILLESSLLYELFKVPYIDAVGSLGIAWYAFREGNEAFQKAKTKKLTCADNCC
jgi:divalent metal cation (Fe/Co/Zn/Cd) transporter